MAFLTQNNSSQARVDGEIAAIVKAHGFEPGNYKFVPNDGATRKEGSIINGVVKGSFTIDNNDAGVIVFDRENFSEKAWKSICIAMGFKYYNYSDIDKFIIMPNSTDVQISLITPTSE